jgi:hypothetical protein
MVLGALLNVAASGETAVNHIYTYDKPFFLKSEPSVTEFYNLTWVHNKDTEKDRRKEMGGPALTSGKQISRKIAWRLEEGQIASIDWKKVQNQFWSKYDIRIGETIEVTVPAMKPVRCYCICGSGYAAYAREVYEIEQKGNTAVVSILRPVDGLAVDFGNCMCLSSVYDFCVGCPQPESMLATCASATSAPLIGKCSEVGTGSKRDFGQDFVSGDDSVVHSNWGTIKELYRSK